MAYTVDMVYTVDIVYPVDMWTWGLRGLLSKKSDGWMDWMDTPLTLKTTGAHAVLIIQLVRLNYMDKFEQFVENSY